MAHQQGFVVAKVPVGQAEHQPIAQGIQLLFCFRLRNTNSSSAGHGVSLHWNRDWPRELRLGGVREVHMKAVQVQRGRAEEVDKEAGLARWRRRSSIRIRWQKRKLIRTLETDSFRFCPGQHRSAVIGASVVRDEILWPEQIIVRVIRVRPYAQLVIVVQYVISELENVAMIFAGC